MRLFYATGVSRDSQQLRFPAIIWCFSKSAHVIEHRRAIRKTLRSASPCCRCFPPQINSRRQKAKRVNSTSLTISMPPPGGDGLSYRKKDQTAICCPILSITSQQWFLNLFDSNIQRPPIMTKLLVFPTFLLTETGSEDIFNNKKSFRYPRNCNYCMLYKILKKGKKEKLILISFYILIVCFFQQLN